MSALLVFDTNVIMDVWLGRDGDQAVLLVQLAEEHKADLVVPEYVLEEFRGTALRWVRDERVRVDSSVRGPANEWGRSAKLDEAAEAILDGARTIHERLNELAAAVDPLIARIRNAAVVSPHTVELHFRGDIRFLSGRPPDRPCDGIKDCRVYEAVLEIARGDVANQRGKYLVSKDGDFNYPDLVAELGALGFTLRSDPGRLYGELRALP